VLFLHKASKVQNDAASDNKRSVLRHLRAETCLREKEMFHHNEVHTKWSGPYLVMVVTVKSVTVGASRLDPISRLRNFSCGVT
jgi:hypothetical protein